MNIRKIITMATRLTSCIAPSRIDSPRYPVCTSTTLSVTAGTSVSSTDPIGGHGDDLPTYQPLYPYGKKDRHLFVFQVVSFLLSILFASITDNHFTIPFLNNNNTTCVDLQ